MSQSQKKQQLKTDRLLFLFLCFITLVWAATKYLTKPLPTNECSTYVYPVVDDLKIRSSPHLDSSIIQMLSLTDSVLYLNVQTAFSQNIRIQQQLFNEPWLKVKTGDEKIGWAYGGGLRFYKHKLQDQ